MSKAKLIDVAQKAGVSKSTASQYINGRYEYMSAKTREKIRVAIEELNFIPNPIARSLKADKTKTIGIIVKSIAGSTTSQMIRGIDDYLKKLDYNVLIYNTDYIKESELKSIEILKSMRADGIIITSSGNISDKLNVENKSGLPIVHILREFEDLDVNTVLSDYQKGSELAGEYLVSLGHKNIAIFTKVMNCSPSRISRVNGCIEVFQKQSLPLDENCIYTLENDQEVFDTFDQLYDSSNSPTAIFSLFSDITIALLNHIQKRNLNLPEDIQLIVFDDLPLGHLLSTPLTVVNQHAYELGINAAKLLLKKISEPSTSTDHVVLPCELIIRKSCAKLK